MNVSKRSKITGKGQDWVRLLGDRERKYRKGRVEREPK